MQRIDAIKNIINTVEDEDIIISSCGRISREVFFVKDRPRNFYVQGSMGATVPIAIGLALSKPELDIIAIVGDGEVLMSLGTLVLLNALQKEKKIKNLLLFILDNNKYQSTGGQKTVSDAVNFKLLCDCNVIFVKDSEVDVPRIKISHVEIKERFMNAIR
jgi:phosphonopyruvate decarboxylase